MKKLIKVSTVLLIPLTLMFIQAGSSMAMQTDRGVPGLDDFKACESNGGKVSTYFMPDGTIEKRCRDATGSHVCIFSGGVATNCYNTPYIKPPATGSVWGGTGGISTLLGSKPVGEINPKKAPPRTIRKLAPRNNSLRNTQNNLVRSLMRNRR